MNPVVSQVNALMAVPKVLSQPQSVLQNQQTRRCSRALHEGHSEPELRRQSDRGAGIPQPLPACPGVPVPGATPQGRARGAGAYLGVLWMLLALWRIWERSHEVVAGTEFLRRSGT